MDINSETDGTTSQPGAGVGRRRISLKRKVLFLAILLVLSFGMIEIICLTLFNAYNRRYVHYALGELYKPNVKRDKVDVHGTTYTFQTNSLGFQGDEFADTKSADEVRILFLGGSTTVNAAHSPENRWPNRVVDRFQRSHRDFTVKYQNCARDGATSNKSIDIALNVAIVKLDPDIIVVLHGINDIHRGQFRDIDAPFGWLQREDRVWRQGRGAFAYYFHQIFVRNNRRLRNWKIRSLPAETRDVENFRGVVDHKRNIRSLAALCREFGIRLVVVTQPFNRSRVDEDHYSDLFQYERLLSLTQTHKAMEHLSRWERDYAASREIVFLADADKVLTEKEDFTDMVHYSPSGQTKMTEVVYFAVEQAFFASLAKEEDSADQ